MEPAMFWATDLTRQLTSAPVLVPDETSTTTRSLSLTKAYVAELASISLIAPLPRPDTATEVPPLDAAELLSADAIAACSAACPSAPGIASMRTTPPPPPVPVASL